MARRVSASEFDAFENSALGFFAEAGQCGDLARFAGGFELVDRFDTELFVQRFDLFGAQAGDLEHLHQAGRDGRFQSVVVSQFAGGDQFSDLFLDALADAFDFGNTVLGDELLERLSQAFEGARGVFIGARLERVLPFEFKQGADLDQDLRHTVFVHVQNIWSSYSRLQCSKSGAEGGASRDSP